VVLAVLIGAALSYLVLDKYRQASAQWLQSRGNGHTKVEDRLESDADAEDALLDEQEQHQDAAHESDAAHEAEEDSQQAVPEDRTDPSDGQRDSEPHPDQ